MKFEYDPAKSDTNFQKHGIDFEAAQYLWLDSNALQIQAKSDTEERYALVAGIQKIIWVAFYTYRKDVIQIISVRRARDNEKRIYDES
ncbi:MAG: BrnT family toxin [Sulfuricurvum sp.]